MHYHPTTKSSVLIGLTLLLSLTGFQCTKGVSQEVAQANRPVTIKWWRTFEDEIAVRPIIEAYKTLHPNVTIEYRKLRFADYESELINALAEDRGPDIISVHASQVREFEPKLAPLPETITLPFQEITGLISKEVTVTLKTTPSLTPGALKESFVDTVAKDVIIPAVDEKGQPRNRIYGLPLSLDTMVLYANRDLLNLAGIPETPKTWIELQAAIKKLTKLSSDGTIIQSGAALGTAHNVERASDILALLMMQNGAEMIDESGSAVFNRTPPGAVRATASPGEQALTFYTDFANPQNESYTWSAALPNSLEAFLSGRTAIFFGYAYHLPLIRARAGRMNLTVAKVPQIEGNPEVNFANYWVEAVSRKSAHQDFAWDFIQFASSPKHVGSYLAATSKPTALRALISSQAGNEYESVFVSEVLTARNWYHGNSAQTAQDALLGAIDATLAGGRDSREILNIAAQRVQQTLR